MAYASRSGHARTSIQNPRAFGVCHRCGQWWNRDQLRDQFEWRGAQLQNIYILVCPRCYDEPQQQLRAITLPADPVPIYRPSVENFAEDETDYRAASIPPVTDPVTGLTIPSNVLRTTENCLNRTLMPYGNPDGLEQGAIMPLQLVNGVPTQFNVVIPILSIYSNGCLQTFTCSSVHNLQPNQQISCEGLTNGNGFYSVQVPTATVFTFETAEAIQIDLTPGTRVVTA